MEITYKDKTYRFKIKYDFEYALDKKTKELFRDLDRRIKSLTIPSSLGRVAQDVMRSCILAYREERSNDHKTKVKLVRRTSATVNLLSETESFSITGVAMQSVSDNDVKKIGRELAITRMLEKANLGEEFNFLLWDKIKNGGR